MAVPSSGELKLYKDIWGDEIGDPQGDNSLHGAAIYAGFSTPDAMSDFYGWSDVIPPSVSTGNFSSVSFNSVTLNGNVTSTGNEDVVRGFYCGTNANSATNNTKLTLGGTQGTGAYSCTRGAGSGTTYYGWAFACNSAGSCIGGRVNTTTPYPPFTPTYTPSFQTGAPPACRFQMQNSGGLLRMQYFNPYSGATVQYNPSPGFSSCYYVVNNTKHRSCIWGGNYRSGNVCCCYGIPHEKCHGDWRYNNNTLSLAGSANFPQAFSQTNVNTNCYCRVSVAYKGCYCNIPSGFLLRQCAQYDFCVCSS
jgi:hypothetical protein